MQHPEMVRFVSLRILQEQSAVDFTLITGVLPDFPIFFTTFMEFVELLIMVPFQGCAVRDLWPWPHT